MTTAKKTTKAAATPVAAATVPSPTTVVEGYGDMVAVGKANVEAVLKTSQILVKGTQDIGKLLFGLTQTSLEDGVVATKKVFTCKTMPEVVALQNDLAKANFKKAVDEGRKLTDMSTKMIEEAAEPIMAQVTKTVEKLSKPLAA